MSRLSSIYDDANKNGQRDPGETIDAAYSYLGAGTIAVEDYASISTKLDYTGGDGSMSGFDRFGRVHEQLWSDYGDDPTTLIDGYTYGYDRAGSRTWKQNATSGAANLDELYTYDAIDQLKTARRGKLKTDYSGFEDNTEQFAQNWTLDALGNMANFKEGEAQGTWSLDQTRAANAANEIDTDNSHINGSGNSIGKTTGTDWYDPTYDAAGNTITAPKPDSPATALTLKYDAWNRTKEVSSSGILLGRYEYL